MPIVCDHVVHVSVVLLDTLFLLTRHLFYARDEPTRQKETASSDSSKIQYRFPTGSTSPPKSKQQTLRVRLLVPASSKRLGSVRSACAPELLPLQPAAVNGFAREKAPTTDACRRATQAWWQTRSSRDILRHCWNQPHRYRFFQRYVPVAIVGLWSYPVSHASGH